MTRSERALQIWPVLTLCATHRQTMTYDRLGRLIGVPRVALGQLLEPIQSYCLAQNLPALTALVVSEVDGLPGTGFIAAADVPKEQARVFAHDWLRVDVAGPYADAVPTAEALEAAAADRLLVETA